MRVATALLLACLLWAPALALPETIDRGASCGGREGVCISFNATDSTNDLGMIALPVGRTYTMMFDPDILTTGVPADGAHIFLRRSLSCSTPSDLDSYRVLVNQNGAGGQDDVSMDGTNTDDDQKAAIYDLPPGCYFIEIATAAAALDIAQVSFEAN